MHAMIRWSQALAVAALLAGALPAQAIECPVPQQGGAGIIRESAADIASLAALLGSGDLDNRIPEIVTGLRRRHPTADAAAIVNYLVAAYCPVVNARADLGEQQKAMRLSSFSSSVFAFAAQP